MRLAFFRAEIRTSLRHAAEVGELLCRTKELVGRGNWKGWLAENCDEISHRTACDYMRVAEHKNLLCDVADDDPNSQFTANLTLAGFLKGLSKPRAKRGGRDTTTTSSRGNTKDDRGCHDHDQDHDAGGGGAEEDEGDPSGASEPAPSTSSSSADRDDAPAVSTTDPSTTSATDDPTYAPAGTPTETIPAGIHDTVEETQWLASLPVRQRLADTSAFDRDALLWRRVQPAVEMMRTLSGPGRLATDDYGKARIGAFCKQRYSRHLGCVVGVKPPAQWTVCTFCRGTGKARTGTECYPCLAGGYAIGHVGDVDLPDDEDE